MFNETAIIWVCCVTEPIEFEDGESRSEAGIPSRNDNSGEDSGEAMSEGRFDEEPLDDDPRVVIGLNRFIDALVQAPDRV